MNKQQLASKIWESANKMRSKIDANDYKDYILGFIFYKFLSDKEEALLKKADWHEADFPELNENDEETVRYCQQQLGYFISYNNLFSTWLNKGRDFDVSNVRDALSAFNRLISDTHKKVFSEIFDTLQTGLSKLGDSAGSQTKSISDLIQVIKVIPTNGSQDYDVLGFIYEYLISNFAANAGKKAGEFYTPHEVSVVMSEIIAHHLSNRDRIEIYDPTSGSGSLLINIGRSISKHINDKNNIKYYAQELKENTYNLTRMNLVMRNILPDNIVVRNADTLEDDWPYFDDTDKERTYRPLYVDAVVSNPPYSQNWDPTNKESDPRYSRFGLAPKGTADFAFLLHDLYHVKPDGIMTIVLPHGVLYRSGEEEKIRTNLIESNHIDAIIGLPANIFFGTSIPTIIMVLKQRRNNEDVLIVDASKGFIKEGKNNRLRACDIKQIVDTIVNRSNIDKYSCKVSRRTIRENKYNLNISRYVDSSAKSESWDIYASMFGGIPNNEIDALIDYWNAFPTLRAQLFHNNDSPYSAISSDNIKQTIINNADVKRFINCFNTAFASLHDYLKEELIDNMLTLNVQQLENKICIDIFERLVDVPLVNKYNAYQLLNNQWIGIGNDLEIIQTEGFEATKVVEPNMIIKKKNGKDEEVQDGWIGRVIPFILVQQTLLKALYDELKQAEAELEKTLSEKNELVQKLLELGVGLNLLNNDNTAFVSTEISKEAKALNKSKVKYEEETIEYIVVTVDALIGKEKKLNKEIKDQTAELHIITKSTIENLTDVEVLMLLELKWITPLCSSLAELPDGIINELVAKTKVLSEKYAVTYLDLERDILEAEQSLSLLIDELDGNEFDMCGLKELQTLLRVDKNEKE